MKKKEEIEKDFDILRHPYITGETKVTEKEKEESMKAILELHEKRMKDNK